MVSPLTFYTCLIYKEVTSIVLVNATGIHHIVFITPMELLPTSRGGLKLSENGFIYLFQRNSEDGLRLYWNCEHVQSGYCKARVHTINLNDEPIAVKRIGTHNHSGDGAKIEIL